QYSRETGVGCSKRRVSNWRRVDSVEVFKSDNPGRTDGSLGDGYVYNFEVEGLHTYIAGGLVVHNCHHVQKTNKWGKAIDLFPNPECLGLGVTASPRRGDGGGLSETTD